MSETLCMWIKVSFDIVYLIAVWYLVIAMYRHRSWVRPEDRRVATLIMIAFMLLALGDTGHVGFRVVIYAQGDTAAQITVLGMPLVLLGLGMLVTLITVTLFYVLMLALPLNYWQDPTSPQPWSTYVAVCLLAYNRLYVASPARAG